MADETGDVPPRTPDELLAAAGRVRCSEHRRARARQRLSGHKVEGSRPAPARWSYYRTAQTPPEGPV